VATWSDAALSAAVTSSRSWRGVLRALGLSETSSAARRAVPRRADELGLDHAHFTGQRRWTDASLGDAVVSASSWTEVARALGLATGSSTTVLKAHAVRLGVATDHLTGRKRPESTAPRPDLDQLPRAGSMVAATWFTLCGFEVAWPLEPCRYDLLAHRDGETLRVQVKTTRVQVAGTWVVSLGTGGRRRDVYDPDDIDCFFIVDGALRQYLVPIEVVAGRNALYLSAYAAFEVAALAPSSPEVP
jgi:hypothetical protein